jgi:peptidoglycan/LPS O-acetylase OafA/YrhL
MGLIRFYLAVSVLIFHYPLTDDSLRFINSLFINSQIAINTFFLMSGFYISLGLNNRYKDPSKNTTFYIGRVLRLWPTYFISLLLLIPTGKLQAVTQWILELPTTLKYLAIFSNTTMIGNDLLVHLSAIDGRTVFSEYGKDPDHNGSSYILNFPSWSLSIEILFYIAAPFIVRSLRTSLIILTISIISCIYVKYINADIASLFRTDLFYQNVFIYFGLGILGYRLSESIKTKSLLETVKIFTPFYLLSAIALPNNYSWLYLMLSLAIPTLFELTKKSNFDKFLGDLSYPIYILHVPIALLIVWALDIQHAPAVPLLFFVIFASSLVVLFVERPIDRFRYQFFKVSSPPLPHQRVTSGT